MGPVFLLAIALAADAAAVSATLGAARPSGRLVVRAALVFGSFQAGMAGLGALGGLQLASWLGPWLGGVAAVVLAVLGVRMLLARDADDVPDGSSLGVWMALGLATSVDALAAGVSLPLFDPPVWLSTALIGGVTAAASAASAAVGRFVAPRAGVWAQRLGGLALVVLGAMALASTLTR